MPENNNSDNLDDLKQVSLIKLEKKIRKELEPQIRAEIIEEFKNKAYNAIQPLTINAMAILSPIPALAIYATYQDSNPIIGGTILAATTAVSIILTGRIVLKMP